jgi:hypothetical protein
MWSPFRKLLARSKTLGSLLGEVLFETPPLKGQSQYSFCQWRVKSGLDDVPFFINLKMLPDGYEGPEGAARNYISFDLETAEHVRKSLDTCILECRRLINASHALKQN